MNFTLKKSWRIRETLFTFVSCLFTISYICLQFQLFVYNFSYLSTFVSCLLTFLLAEISCLFTISAVCLQFEFSCQIEFFHFVEIFHSKIQNSIWRHLVGILGTIENKITLPLQLGKNVTFVPSDTDYDIPMDHWNMTSRDDRKSHLLQGIRLSTEFINSLMWFATIRKLTEYRGSARVLDTRINGKEKSRFDFTRKFVKTLRFYTFGVVDNFDFPRNIVKSF